MAGVKRDNPNAFKQLEMKFKELASAQVKIGWFENDKEENGTPSAYAASIQEFGYKKIPPRLGMRETMDEKKSSWKDFSKAAAKQVLKGSYTGRDAMEALGNKAWADFYARINSNPAPPLSPLTLALRYQREQGKKITGTLVGQTAARLHAGDNVRLSSNTQALVDTGRLLNNLRVLVEDA